MYYINKNYVLKSIYNDKNECINDTLSSTKLIFVCIYVDDILVISPHSSSITSLL